MKKVCYCIVQLDLDGHPLSGLLHPEGFPYREKVVAELECQKLAQRDKGHLYRLVKIFSPEDAEQLMKNQVN